MIICIWIWDLRPSVDMLRIEFLKTDTVKVSVRTLPRRPTIMVPPGL